MKDLGAKCFRRRAWCYGGQVGFTKMDAAQIRWIKAAALILSLKVVTVSMETQEIVATLLQLES